MTEKTPRPSKRPKPNSKNPARAESTHHAEPRRSTPAPRRVTPQPARIGVEPRKAERPRSAEPEIRVAIAPAGRETLDAIASELSPKKAPRSKARSHAESSPEIVIEQRPVGRDTLAAINEELTAHVRDTLPTLPYGDRVPNAPGAITPSRAPEPALEEPWATLADAEIFEMRTFVVQKADVQSLETEAARLRFVSSRLVHRLPGGSAVGVTRVDMTPWTEPDTLILRVWCRVDPGG